METETLGPELKSNNTYTFVQHKELLARAPDIDGINAQVWTIKQDSHIRVNYVEMQGELSLHLHPDADHSLMVLSGQIEAIIAGESKQLSAGDFISIPKNVPHKYRVLGANASIVSMDAPYYDPRKTIVLE